MSSDAAEPVFVPDDEDLIEEVINQPIDVEEPVEVGSQSPGFRHMQLLFALVMLLALMQVLIACAWCRYSSYIVTSARIPRDHTAPKPAKPRFQTTPDEQQIAQSIAERPVCQRFF